MSLGWEFILAESHDRSTIGKLRNAHDRKLDFDLNKNGSASSWIPTSDKNAKSIWPWASCIIAQFDNVPLWSGPINSRSTDMEAGKRSFTAVGWFARLEDLVIKETNGLSFSNMDAGAIVAALLANARAQDPTLEITLGVVETTQPRTVTFTQDQTIGSCIQQLCELESGFDWYIDPITIKLNIVRKLGIDRPDVRWQYIGDGKSLQSNLLNVVENVDGAVVNDSIVRGNGVAGGSSSLPSQQIYGLHTGVTSLSDVVDLNILISYANVEILYKSIPRVTYQMTPKPSPTVPTPGQIATPRIGREFNLGDTTYATFRKDDIDVEGQATRIFGASLDISDAGDETLTNVQTTAS
jgi:hypothetical protein